MIIAGLEVYMGCLIWILPIPPSKYVAGMLIVDGGKRFLDALQKRSEEEAARRKKRHLDALR